MIVPLPEIVLTTLLAVGFAAIGEIVLRRRSADLFSWNESFLVGAGCCSAALFPASLIWSFRTLHMTVLVMLLATVFLLARRLIVTASARPEPPSPASQSRRASDGVAVGLIVLLVLVAATFTVLNFRYNYLWDGFQIWATRAELLYHQGGLTRWWFPEDSYDARVLAYPPLVPLYEALLCLVRGGFDFGVLKPVFIVFYLSMLISTFAATRAVTNLRLAFVATLLLALLRPLSCATAAGGYADMPQAALVAGVVAAALRRPESVSALPWMIGSLTTGKAEGILLAGVASFAVLLFWYLEGPRQLKKRLRSRTKEIAVVVAFVVSRLGYVHWLDINDTTFNPLDAGHIGPALGRSWHVARLCLEVMLKPLDWGFFWPAFLVAGLALVTRGRPRERCLAAATAAGAIVYAVPFLLTTWPLDIHIAQAYFRLLAQLAPAAAVCIVLGYTRARSERAVSSFSVHPRHGHALVDLQ